MYVGAGGGTGPIENPDGGHCPRSREQMHVHGLLLLDAEVTSAAPYRGLDSIHQLSFSLSLRCSGTVLPKILFPSFILSLALRLVHSFLYLLDPLSAHRQ